MNTLFPVTRFGTGANIPNLLEEFDNMFNSLLTPVRGRRSATRSLDQAATIPRANVLKMDSGYSIELAAPGFSRDDFSINVEGNLLTISVNSEDTKDYLSRLTAQEYSLSSFSRTWTLPEMVNMQAIDARYEAGILSVDIPVEGRQEQSLKIEVK